MKKIFFYTISIIIIMILIYYYFYNKNITIININNDLSIKLSNNKTITLLGIKVLETKKNDAKKLLEKLLINKKILLKYDYSIPTDFYTKYVYLYNDNNNISINELLIKKQYAICHSPFPFTKFYRFKILEKNSYPNHKKTYKTKNIKSKKSNKTNFFIANKLSKKIHKPNCRFAKKISDSNKIIFKNLQNALKQGYQKCRICF